MAEMVSSAVAQEAVSRVLSSIKDRYEGESNATEHIERMEMAQIKLEAALETSDKWNVTSMPLLRWQRKLKRVAQECDDTLRSCRQRLKEKEEMEQRLRNSSFPMRIAHTTRLLVASIFNSGNNEPNRSTVRRFEWFAEGASEFLRNVESGGTPCRCISLDPLVRYLLTGKGTKYSVICGSQYLYLMIRPFSHPKYGIQGRLKFLLQDNNVPENNFHLDLHLRLSESTDIVGVIIRCMQLFTPHLRSTAETVQTKLTHLPMQDFLWVPDYSICKEHWNRHHIILYKWFRPNPLCCQQHNHHYDASNTCSLSESFQCDIYLEPVTVVYLQGYVALSARQKRRKVVVGGKTCPTRDFPFLKLEGIFSPHASSEDLLSTVGGSATELINGETAQRSLCENISFEEISEIMLPRAVDCFRGNAAATSYQMLWKSKHAGAYIRIEESSWRETNGKNRGRKRQKCQGKKVQVWTVGISEFVGSWVVDAPVQIQGSIADWVQKEKQMPLCWWKM